MNTTPVLRTLAALALLAAAACSESGQPLAPENPAPQTLAEMDCVATLSTRSVTCGEIAAGGPSKVVAGNQGVYVRLISSNITTEADTFGFDVAVQNLIPQALGTEDGSTLHPEAVRVFFHIPPFVKQGAGSVSVGNPDGQMDVTGLAQDYYQYDEILEPNETSGIRRWKLVFTPGVDQIGLKMYVTAKVPHPQGYVELSGGNPFQLTGTTQSFTGVVRTEVGNVVADSITWATSDSMVATVDASGTLTAVAPGRVIVTATAGARTGVDTVDVCPDLPVGGVYTASMPSASKVCFGGQSGVAEYTYMPVNLSTSSSLSLSVTATGIQAVTGPPSPNIIPEGGMLNRLSATDGTSAFAVMLDRDKRAMEHLLPVSRTAKATGPRRVITPGVPTVGDLMELNTNRACTGSPSLRTGQVRSVKTNVIVISDTANPAGGFTTAQYDSIALEFDSLTYPVDTLNFGAPTDRDGNGRIILFYTRAVNELQAPASAQPENGYGYFASKDVFDPADCSNSNVGEILYMMVPDPTGAVNSNVRTVSLVRGNTIRQTARDLQHLINAMRRAYVTSASFFETAWLDEALSSVAQELVFYRTAVGLAPRGNIQLSSLTTGPNASRRVAAFNTYANQNFGGFRAWLQRPDTSGAFKGTVTSAGLGVTWAFLRYSVDRVNGTDAAFWRSLVNSNLEGKANIQNAIGADPDAWLRDFTAAMYADDAVTGIAATYTQPSWNFRSVYGGLGGVPLLARSLANATALTLSYSRGGGTAYMRFGTPASGFATVTALSGGVAPTSPYQLIVVRTK